MTEHEPTPSSTPLDAEREKLRAAGYTDSEISQILISRATGAGGASAGPGTMSNVIGSLVAVAGYAAGLFLGFRADAATLFDGGAKSGVRVGAALALTFKLVVIGVLGYGAWQEWQQHIISGTQTAANNADLTAAQAKKMQAEADAAAQVAAGEKAKSCKERLDLMSQNLYLEDMNPDATVKPGTRTARMLEKYNKDCGPITGASTPDEQSPADAAKAKECAQEFDALFSQLQQVDRKDTAAFDKVGIELFFKHREKCPFTAEQQEKLDPMKAEIAASSERVKIMAAGALVLKYGEEATKEFSAGHYDAAYDFEKKRVEMAEDYDTKTKGHPAALTAEVCVGASWRALFARKFDDAIDSADRAVQLDPPETIALINKAHALMFLGRKDEAKALYLAHRGEKIEDKRTWNDAITKDFADLRNGGLTNPFMDEVTRDLSGQESNSAAPPSPSSLPVATPSPAYSALVTPGPSPAPTALRTPAAFDCVNGKHMGTDYVICASPKLLDAEARLEDAYQAAHAARGDAVKSEQWDWIKSYGPNCGLPLRGRPSDNQISGATACVGAAMDNRIRELQAEQ